MLIRLRLVLQMMADLLASATHQSTFGRHRRRILYSSCIRCVTCSAHLLYPLHLIIGSNRSAVPSVLPTLRGDVYFMMNEANVEMTACYRVPPDAVDNENSAHIITSHPHTSPHPLTSSHRSFNTVGPIQKWIPFLR